MSRYVLNTFDRFSKNMCVCVPLAIQIPVPTNPEDICHLAPQIAAFGRANVFLSAGIPCGCCGSDEPAVQPMNASLAMGYIHDE